MRAVPKTASTSTARSTVLRKACKLHGSGRPAMCVAGVRDAALVLCFLYGVSRTYSCYRPHVPSSWRVCAQGPLPQGGRVLPDTNDDAGPSCDDAGGGGDCSAVSGGCRKDVLVERRLRHRLLAVAEPPKVELALERADERRHLHVSRPYMRAPCRNAC